MTADLRDLADRLAKLADMTEHQWLDEYDAADVDPQDERFHDLAHALATADDCKRDAAAVHAQLEQAVASVLEHDSGFVEVPGLGAVQRRVGRPRVQWNHHALLDEMAQRAMTDDTFWVDTDTGELAEATPAEAIRRLALFAGFGYWKVKALRSVGIDPDEFSTAKAPKVSVEMNRVEGGDGDG